MIAAVHVEWTKLRRSPVTWVATVLMVLLLPGVGLAFSQLAERGGTGAVALKAGALITGEGWDAYLAAVDQIAAAAMFLGAGIVVAWTFGREHADRTFAALFALPISRGRIATAKYIVLLGWVIGLSMFVVLTTTTVGVLVHVEPFELGTHGSGIARLFGVASSTTTLALTIGWIASVGRGYLPAIGALVLILVAAQVAVLFGTAGWFPFAVPGLLAVAGEPGVPALHGAQVALVPLTTAFAAAMTVRWWRTAEVV